MRPAHSPAGLAQRLPRRGFLAGGLTVGATAALGGAACSPGVDGNAVAPSELYVGLGRARQIAILDASSERIIGRISLQGMGDRGAPAQISVGPSGSAAVLPLVSADASIGLVQSPEEADRATERRKSGAGAAATPGPVSRERRTAWLRLGERQAAPVDAAAAQPRGGQVRSGTAPGSKHPLITQAAQRLSADGLGNAYVVVADGGATLRPHVAVIDMHTGEQRRRIPVADTGESVLALLADQEGRRLYVAIWSWVAFRPGTFNDVKGRLVALDAHTGAILGRAPLPADCAATELTLAAAPPGSPGAGSPTSPCIYATTSTPGPFRDESAYWGVDRRHALIALDPDTLDVVGTWSLDRQPSALAMMPNGTRAYVLAGSGFNGPWSRELVSVDLTSSNATRRWPLPDGCFSLALSPVGKVYVADALGDRLWRVDVRQNSNISSIPLPGAPLSLATRPA